MKNIFKRFVTVSFAITAVLVLSLFWITMATGASPETVSFQQESWRRGYCPFCSGLPEYAYLKDEGACWLVCHDCGREWLFQRLRCPYCDNQDHDTLGYFFTDEHGLLFCRFYVCEVCHKYIKTTDLRSGGGGVLTTLQNVMIQDIERRIQTMGYKPGWMR